MSPARSGVAADDWDATVHAWGGHFLQSTAWQRVQAALGHDVLHARGHTWAWAGPVRGGLFPRYMYLPYGPTAEASLAPALEAAIAAAREHQLHFVRVEPVAPEPRSALQRAGAVSVRHVQPSQTWVLDISQSEDALRRGLSAGHRGSINAAPRRGLSVRHTADPADITILLDLQRRAHAAGGFPGQPERYHRVEASVLMPIGAARIYLIDADGSPVAAAMCFDWQDTRYYAHAASDPVRGRKLGAAAPLVWQMILDARAAGMRRFDFWGVVPDAPSGHPWAGFSRFKMAFGGSLVQRAGTWELPVRRFPHRVYRLVRRSR